MWRLHTFGKLITGTTVDIYQNVACVSLHWFTSVMLQCPGAAASHPNQKQIPELLTNYLSWLLPYEPSGMALREVRRSRVMSLGSPTGGVSSCESLRPCTWALALSLQLNCCFAAWAEGLIACFPTILPFFDAKCRCRCGSACTQGNKWEGFIGICPCSLFCCLWWSGDVVDGDMTRGKWGVLSQGETETIMAENTQCGFHCQPRTAVDICHRWQHVAQIKAGLLLIQMLYVSLWPGNGHRKPSSFLLRLVPANGSWKSSKLWKVDVHCIAVQRATLLSGLLSESVVSDLEYPI